MYTFLNILQKLIWGWPSVILILIFGLYLSIRLKFFQILKIKSWLFCVLRDLFSKSSHKRSGISPLAAVSTALAGSAGTGNIIGVALAIAIAGPGVVFWIWFSSFFSMITVFGENILGARYRISKNGSTYGGAMYYIEKGLKSKKLALLFSSGCVLSSLGMGNMVQSAAACEAVERENISPVFFGAVLSITVFLIICGGFKRVSSFTEKLIPFITAIYIILCIVILFKSHRNLIPSVNLIINKAFSFKAAAGGITSSFLISFKEGISKGIFTNEAGLGSSVMANCASSEKDPVHIGMWGIFQVFLDTSIMCTLTGLCITVTGAYRSHDCISMCSHAFESAFGYAGHIFVVISIVIFAFATVISWYTYGEFSFRYIAKAVSVYFFRICFAACTFISCIFDISDIWILSDIFNGIMALPNIAALFLLSDEIIFASNSYFKKN